MDEYDHRLIVHPTGHDDLAYVGWEVRDELALETAVNQLKAAGIGVSSGTSEEAETRCVLGFVRFQDPNGIPSELFYGPLLRFDERFRSPRPIAGFESGVLGLGHIVIAVDDLTESVRFYRDLLGMRISDFIRLDIGSRRRVTIAFLRCNPRHHSVALVPMPSEKRLQHFMVQLESLDDVGATYYLCQERGAPTSSLRRHTNDHMLSF
jgi:2,3-dihydroxybiphenyl 1,2-dioxygenase